MRWLDYKESPQCYVQWMKTDDTMGLCLAVKMKVCTEMLIGCVLFSLISCAAFSTSFLRQRLAKVL